MPRPENLYFKATPLFFIANISYLVSFERLWYVLFIFFVFWLNSKQSNYIKVIYEEFQFNGADDSTGDNSDWKFRKFSTCDFKFTLWTSCSQIFKSFYWIFHEKLKFNEKITIFSLHFDSIFYFASLLFFSRIRYS